MAFMEKEKDKIINPLVFKHFNLTKDSPEWNDWHWQFSHRITDVEELSQVIKMTEKEKEEVTKCLGSFRMAISPYYASLINPENIDDPIRKQAVPSIEEMKVYPWEKKDPLNEDGDSPTSCIVHRYPDRVLFLVTKCCAMYCRHCTRRRLVGEEDQVISPQEMEEGLDYIRKTKQVRDVLISGGDPLTLSDQMLDHILSELRKIEHVEIIRIGTRVPVTLPMRITPSLLNILKKYHPLWINTHFNHPNELTPEAVKACELLADDGIPLGNQSVLLRGVNDTTSTMKKLVLGLLKARVRPYYLYQCDLSEGLEHFRTDVRTGIKIIQELQGNITGFAVPKFVIDSPGGGGKVPFNPDYILSLDDKKAVFKNYQGKVFEYPQPEFVSKAIEKGKKQ
jgi:lysine 2,3-aminomutase